VDGGGDTAKIVNPGTRPVPEANEVCGRCHERGTHPAVAGSAPDPRDTACATCHSVHAPKGRKLLKRAGADL
jgi:predicted CXXCH cytochrome family protein